MTGGLSLTVQQSQDAVFGLLRAKAHTDRELYVCTLVSLSMTLLQGWSGHEREGTSATRFGASC